MKYFIEISNSNESPNPTQEKKNWVSPELINWETIHLENAPAIANDGPQGSYA